MKEKTKITVVGSGYVGMSLAVLLAQNNEVTVLDIDQNRIESINRKQSTIEDEGIENYLNKEELSISATSSKKQAYQAAEFIIVATPTDYDPNTNKFDTSSVDGVVSDILEINRTALIVIKSTIPVGHTNFLQKNYDTSRVVFSPEFLREGRALEDNLMPSRIIIGSESEQSKEFIKLLLQCVNKENVPIMYTSSSEAEAIKLFANTYLAMRVSFFNELDTFALVSNLDTQDIINGVCHDDRIGQGYNNPSLGYGGYCLPKDTKQLLSNYAQVPQTLIKAIVSSNTKRKDFLAEQILKSRPERVGFFRLAMKQGSDNFRSSAILGIIRRIKEEGIEVLIYEPSIQQETFLDSRIINDLDTFKNLSDIVVSNRNDQALKDIENKLFCRDLFHEN